MAKAKEVLVVVAKVVMILTCLYFFICSLSFLSDSFRLLGGRNLGGEFGFFKKI
jgi:sodium-dependent phosphate cotransporter